MPGSTREQIIAAVVRIMGADGAAAVTNRRIAAEAGVSLGTLTYHFATQRDLVQAGMAAFVADETVKFTQLADHAAASTSDLGQVAELLGDVVSGTGFGGDHLAWFELFVQAARYTEQHEATAEFFATYDRLATTVLHALAVDDAESMAALAVATLIGLQLRRLATGGDADVVVDGMTKLVRALTNRPTPRPLPESPNSRESPHFSY
ncbi:TetR/AcrR family transcriptional regulator [Nocardia caishijiensis]|uniref:TetR family transcriptional regulator n=1 Tax=Nocardia caishijiensis TaxID=184756 RepID=A0ABQ6YRQ5_9NOCA|nr:TetR/AcrR family transcriptional regulator [Nocardia caishijiensis]KAF0848492.1 TetR family transcriptional regulator [Nocardia caishijiensis]